MAGKSTNEDKGLLTIREVAKVIERTDRATRQLLRRLFDEEREERPGIEPDWRVWDGRKGSKQLFNVSRLKRAQPSLFRLGPVDRAEFAALSEQVDALRLELRRLKARTRMLEAAKRKNLTKPDQT